MKISFLEGEVWYPAVSSYGTAMPYTKEFTGEVKFRDNPTPNQMTPLLLSNKGRLVYKEDGFNANFSKGSLETDVETTFVEGLVTLREAYKYAVKHYFDKEEINIPIKFTERPVYNTWMYAPFDVTQEQTISYAEDILELGLPAGTIMIDDKWNKEYGEWEFDEKKFPSPDKMAAALKEMGFSLMLWVCPYISFGTKAYEYCLENNLLLMDGEEAFKLVWWNETSACLDLRKEEALDYMRGIFKRLTDIGVDGFKMDGGDSTFYKPEHEPDKQSYLWAKLAAEYPFNEIRADFNTAGMSIFERLCDKRHEWGERGIAALVPDTLALGLAGHPFTSPDMIGGGEVSDIREGCELKKDIFLAHAGIAALLPSMQFSVFPKLVLGDETDKLLSIMKVREKYLVYMTRLFKECAKSKEPVVRLLEYVFPDEGFENVTDMFMLGDKYLVVPITKKDEVNKLVRLPKGKWLYEGKEYSEKIMVELRLDSVVVIEKN